jgi:cell division septation protein DedD
MLKVMELITRARVSIGQENIGLVRDDLQAAIDILVDLGPEVTAEQASYLDDISQRLSFAIENISESPDLVDEDLEVAWQMLLKGLPDETDGIEEGKTQEQLEEGDQVSTPSPSPTNTPTPTLVIPGGQEKLTLSPSPTPTATVTPTPTEKP